MAEQLEAAVPAAAEEPVRGVFGIASDYAYSTVVAEDGSMQVEWLTEDFALTFEVDPDQPSELGVLSAVHPEDRAEADRGVEMVRAGREFLAELRLRTRTGRPVWTLCYARPVMDRDTGRLVRVNGAVRDITERKRGEEKLEHGIELLRRTDQERRGLLGRLVTTPEGTPPLAGGRPDEDPVDGMSAASWRLEILSQGLADPRHAGGLREAEEMVNRAVDALRRVMFDLQPPELDDEGVAAAMWAYMEGARAETGMKYRLENRLEAEPEVEVRVLLYRIVQEALSNVRRHSRAENVEVLVANREGGVFVRVWDDGLGFTAQEVLPEHTGLDSMRERAEHAGGWCTVQSLPAMGTKVELWLPTDGGAPAAGEPEIDTFAAWSL